MTTLFAQYAATRYDQMPGDESGSGLPNTQLSYDYNRNRFTSVPIIRYWFRVKAAKEVTLCPGGTHKFTISWTPRAKLCSNMFAQYAAAPFDTNPGAATSNFGWLMWKGLNDRYPVIEFRGPFGENTSGDHLSGIPINFGIQTTWKINMAVPPAKANAVTQSWDSSETVLSAAKMSWPTISQLATAILS